MKKSNLAETKTEIEYVCGECGFHQAISPEKIENTQCGLCGVKNGYMYKAQEYRELPKMFLPGTKDSLAQLQRESEILGQLYWEAEGVKVTQDFIFNKMVEIQDKIARERSRMFSEIFC